MAESSRPLIAEYKARFPEISDEVLAQIIREYGSDPNTCQKVLQEESRKCLYGCLPTESPVSVTKPLTVLTTKTSPGTNSSPTSITSFVRSNSTGSASSSGRSTPVNQIPTPWVVPRYQSPINPFNMTMASNQQISPIEGYPPSNDNAQTTSPGNLAAAASMLYQTSPNGGYPSVNTSGNYPVRTGTSATSGSHGPQAIMHPLMNGAQGTYQGSGYYTMPNANLGPADPRYHVLPVSSSCDLGAVNSPLTVGTKIGTPYFAPNKIPRPNFGQLYVRTNESLDSADESQFNPLRQASPAVSGTVISPSISSPSTRSEATYLATNAEFVPITLVGSPNTQHDLSSKPYVSGAHSAAMRQYADDGLDSSATGAMSTLSRQRSVNDDYLEACLSQQWKRFQNLEKARAVEKDTLELLIQEISDRDDDLYNQKYRVAPNPTDEQIHQLTEENKQLNKIISEISKNVDRLENGQDVLPPPNPQVYQSHRIPGPSHEGPVHLDRSNSVPYIHVNEQHPLQHQLSEQNIQYTLTPSSLEDWSMINAHPPPNTIPANNEDQQWNCSKCTFLNHESLLVCEICGANRVGPH